MHPADNRYDLANGDIFARDGNTIHRLTLQVPDVGGKPVLVDVAGAVFNPWEVELLRWPPEVETALWHGGYLPGWPAEMELWCNCAD
ncbi:MAG: hypothetical protein WAV07_00120 [Candidatus Contendobacter sp.]